MRNLVRASALALTVVFCTTTVALAAPVNFTTTGSFNGGGNSITFGSGADTTTLTFLGVSSTVDADPVTYASFGAFQTLATGSGAAITGGNFDLNITQTVPAAGSGVASATLSGQIRPNSSTGLAEFTIDTVTIGGVIYNVVNNPLPLVPPNTNNGITTIQGQIIIPEPASLGLLGAAGLLALRRRR